MSNNVLKFKFDENANLIFIYITRFTLVLDDVVIEKFYCNTIFSINWLNWNVAALKIIYDILHILQYRIIKTHTTHTCRIEDRKIGPCIRNKNLTLKYVLVEILIFP